MRGPICALLGSGLNQQTPNQLEHFVELALTKSKTQWGDDSFRGIDLVWALCRELPFATASSFLKNVEGLAPDVSHSVALVLHIEDDPRKIALAVSSAGSVNGDKNFYSFWVYSHAIRVLVQTAPNAAVSILEQFSADKISERNTLLRGVVIASWPLGDRAGANAALARIQGMVLKDDVLIDDCRRALAARFGENDVDAACEIIGTIVSAWSAESAVVDVVRSHMRAAHKVSEENLRKLIILADKVKRC